MCEVLFYVPKLYQNNEECVKFFSLFLNYTKLMKNVWSFFLCSYIIPKKWRMCEVFFFAPKLYQKNEECVKFKRKLLEAVWVEEVSAARLLGGVHLGVADGADVPVGGQLLRSRVLQHWQPSTIWLWSFFRRHCTSCWKWQLHQGDSLCCTARVGSSLGNPSKPNPSDPIKPVDIARPGRGVFEIG